MLPNHFANFHLVHVAVEVAERERSWVVRPVLRLTEKYAIRTSLMKQDRIPLGAEVIIKG